jgi:hypothetical protein
MAQIKISVRIHKGEKGIPLLKLSSISDRLVDFLNAICKDNNIKIDENNWMAHQFRNKSVGFIAQNPKDVDIKDVEYYNNTLECIIKNKFSEKEFGKTIMPSTIIKATELVKDFGMKEKLTFGLYNGKPKLEKLIINSLVAKKINEKVEKLNKILRIEQKGFVKYYGEIRGKIRTWYIGADEPHIIVREARTGENIKCIYSADMYKIIQELTKREGAYLYIFGLIIRNKKETKIDSFEIKKALIAPEYQEGDWEKFFGCSPNITSGFSSEEFISGVRNDGE